MQSNFKRSGKPRGPEGLVQRAGHEHSAAPETFLGLPVGPNFQHMNKELFPAVFDQNVCYQDAYIVDLSHSESRAPLLLQDVQANLTLRKM